MKLHHHTAPAAPAAERGRALAAACGAELRRAAAGYLDFFRGAGCDDADVRASAEASLEALDAWRPQLATELRAVAEGAALAPWQVAAVNARTEILAAAQAPRHECSTVVGVPADGAPWGLQTWDWHPSLVPDGLVWSIRTPAGRRVTTFTEFGAQAKIGVNDAGLGVHFNILSHRDDSGTGGVPVHSIARAVLEEAATVEEARDIIRTAPVCASTALTVIARSPADAVSFELSPGGAGEVRPDTTGILVRTNHFLDAELAEGESVALGESKTRERLSFLASVAPRTGAAGTSAERFAALHEREAGAVLCFVPDDALPDAQRWQTLVTVGIDLGAAALDLSPDAPGVTGTTVFTRY